MDLPGNFVQVMAFYPNSQVSNKVLVLTEDVSSCGMLIAPWSLKAFLYDKEKSLCSLGVRGAGNGASLLPSCFLLVQV